MAEREPISDAARETLVVIAVVFYVIALYHVYTTSGISDLLALIAAIVVFVTIDLEDEEISGTELFVFCLIAVFALPLYFYLLRQKGE